MDGLCGCVVAGGQGMSVVEMIILVEVISIVVLNLVFLGSCCEEDDIERVEDEEMWDKDWD